MLRYLEAGHGVPLVHLQGAGELRLTAAHERLARGARVLVFEPGDGPEAASAVTAALTGLGIDTFNLLGTAAGGVTALRLARQAPARVLALVLESPGARPELPLSEVTTPTLVLLGTMDGDVTPDAGRVYKTSMPSCHLVYVYAATHAIGFDRPEAFAAVVADFLERREAFVISRTETVIHP